MTSKIALLFLWALIFHFPSKVSAQSNKDIIYYKAALISQEVVQNNFDLGKEKKQMEYKIVGKDVEISIDTVFKKYTILFTTEEYRKSTITLKYLRTYFPDNKKNPDISKIYLMSYQNKNFMVIDYLDLFLHELNICLDEIIPTNCTLLYRVKDATRVYK